MGNSEALKSSTIRLATLSGRVSCLNGSSGEEDRASIAGSAARTAMPTNMGTSASSDNQPSTAAVTMP